MHCGTLGSVLARYCSRRRKCGRKWWHNLGSTPDRWFDGAERGIDGSHLLGLKMVARDAQVCFLFVL